MVQFTVLLNHPVVMLLPYGDEVFCNLNYKAACPEKFLENFVAISRDAIDIYKNVLQKRKNWSIIFSSY